MKPMLAASLDPNNLNLTYPVMASVKLDGVRCIIKDGVALSRSLKPIPNPTVQKMFGRKEFHGMDGELIVGLPYAKDVFNQTSSLVMSKRELDMEEVGQLTFHVFDYTEAQMHTPFLYRYKALGKMLDNRTPSAWININLLHHATIESEKELLAFDSQALSQGYEGTMVRSPSGLYKHGRSTLKEGYLMKLKRFEDGEAVVMAVNPLEHNINEATINALGHKERSSKMMGKIASDEMLGSLTVRDRGTGVIFDIGTGFTETQRREYWANPPLDRIVKYKSQLVGAKDRPRFPVFLGFRDEKDL